MQWADELNSRAMVMDRMLGTIAAINGLPEGMCVGRDLRRASAQCCACGKAEGCATQFADDIKTGTMMTPAACPNASLFIRWQAASGASTGEG